MAADTGVVGTSFSVTHEDRTGASRARVGVVRTPRGVSAETPVGLVSTRKGLPLHLTPDNLRRVGDARAIGLCAAHLLDLPGLHGGSGGVAMAVPDVQASPGAVRADWLQLMSVRDPLSFNVNLRRAKSRDALSVETDAGSVQLTCARYLDLVRTYQPDWFVSLGDESAPGAHPHVNGTGATDKHARFLRDTASAVAAARAPPNDGAISGGDAGGDALAGVGMLAAVGARGGDPEASARAADAAVELAGAAATGFAVVGLGLGEEPTLRRACLAAIGARLPPEKIRYAAGIQSLGDALQAIACGMDVVDTPFVDEATWNGEALLPLDFSSDISTGAVAGNGGGTGEGPTTKKARREGGRGEEEEGEGRVRAAGDGTDFSDATFPRLNLWHATHARSRLALCPGCDCFCCRGGYTRGYIHHLLMEGELLGSVLLDLHNHHVSQAWFKSIRDAIRQGHALRQP